MSSSRLLLAWTHAGRIGTWESMAEVFRRGWHFDLVVIAAVCGAGLLVQWLAPAGFLRSATWRHALAAWLGAWLVLIVWNEAATPAFMGEFGVRPNYLYFEYLDAPRVVLTTIWLEHRVALLAGVFLATATGWLAWVVFPSRQDDAPPVPLRLLCLAPVMVAAFVGVRGSAGHRPLGMSFAAIGTDSIVNELALNSTYSALHALHGMLRESRELVPYGDLPRNEVIERVRRGMQLPSSAFTDPSRPSWHRLEPTTPPGRRRNLVILLQESLGAHYLASLGGEPVAVRLDGWRERSLWFDQLYASGTRSARGLEAIVTGFPPTRSASVLTLEAAQHHFFTLARALKAQGYRTEFIYGGDSTFDNMRGFFLSNGFDRVIDFSDLADGARFRTTWGVSDEDLYARVHQEITGHHRRQEPFFTLAFSTSNHPPYDFPADRIALYEQPSNTPNNAARYADFAVGTYLETAERSPYWNDTLFMVVADHESRVVGEGLVPVLSFHIPGFIAGGGVEPRIVSRIAGQLDLLPTALSLMGVAAGVPSTGLDETRTDLVGPGRALMQFNDSAAFRVGDDVVVLRPDQPPLHFVLAGQTMRPAARDDDLEREALAYTEWPTLAYSGGMYR